MNLTVKSALVGLTLGAFIGTGGAAQASHGGEPHPPGYGSNPCVTLLYDLTTARQVYTDQMIDRREHLVGCTDREGDFTYAQDGSNICQRLAYREARRLAPGGLLVDLAKIGPKVSGLTGDRCTVEEDWSWSWK